VAVIAATVQTPDLISHLLRYDTYPGTTRSVWRLMPLGWRDLRWTLEEVPVSSLPDVVPESDIDVRRYAASAENGSPFPALIVHATSWGSDVLDGHHRLAAARLLGQKNILAYVGRQP
jgi:hypothetical protein